MTATIPNPVWAPNVSEPQAFPIEVFNDTCTASRPLGPYISARFGWYWRLPGTGTIRVKADHPLAARLMSCKRAVVPIRTHYNGVPWSGRVFDAVMEGKPGEEIVTATLMGDLYWVLTLLCWVNPFFPPEVQIGLTGKQDIMFGPVDFVYKYFLAKNVIRMQKPVYAKLPIQYHVPELPQLDDLDTLDDILDAIHAFTSDLCVVSARFTRLDELMENAIAVSDRGLTAELWVPKDGPSPWVFNTDTLARLANVLDLSGDNFFWFTNPDNVLGLADPDQWGKLQHPGIVFDTRIKRDRTWMEWRTDSGWITHYKRGVSHPRAHSAIVGGKAPDFINQGVEWAANLALKFLLNILLPGAGLGDILVGDLFDDIFFAYQRFDDPQLEADLGPFAFGEIFADNSNAYSLDSWAVGVAALNEAGGGESFKIEVQAGINGRGFQFGADDGSGTRFREGDIMSFYDRGTRVANYISSVEVEDQRGGRTTEYISVGDDDAAEDAMTVLLGRVKDLANFSRSMANSTG
ncbi:hypothetical protein [Nocardia asteroides]|uniref:Gp37-like protein n=1 Tax=Nocardia asteroides TaxID=1824 RepID=UPI003404906D